MDASEGGELGKETDSGFLEHRAGQDGLQKQRERAEFWV